MNERIRQLAIEAKLIASEPNGFDQNNLSKAQQKFAELIVRDVVATVKRTQVTSPDFEWAILNNYDFGVEE